MLTALGLLVSSAASLLLVGVSLGTQRTAQNQFADLALLRQINVSPNAAEGLILNNKTLRKISAQTGVEKAVPRLDGRFFQTLRIGKYSNFGILYGLGVEDLAELGYTVEAGTSALKKGTVVMDQRVLDSFMGIGMLSGFRPYKAEDLVDRKFNLELKRQNAEGKTETKIIRLRIGGVLKAAGEETYALGSFFMSLSEAKELNEWVSGQRVDYNRTGYDDLIVLAEDVSQVKPLLVQLSATGYPVSATNLALTEGISSTYALIQIMLAGSGVTALLVAIVTLTNTMTTVVLERTREIGLMKALGASRWDVLRLFLGEAVSIGLLGGGLGALFGASAGLAVDRVGKAYLIAQGAPSSLSVDLTPWLFAGSLFGAALVAGLAGLAPALRASRLQPVMALKQRQ
jgi:putative ABC transport system permease protein